MELTQNTVQAQVSFFYAPYVLIFIFIMQNLIQYQAEKCMDIPVKLNIQASS